MRRWIKFAGVYILLEFGVTLFTGWPGFFQVAWMSQYGANESLTGTYAMFYLLTPAALLLPFHAYAAWHLSGC